MHFGGCFVGGNCWRSRRCPLTQGATRRQPYLTTPPPESTKPHTHPPSAAHPPPNRHTLGPPGQPIILIPRPTNPPQRIRLPRVHRISALRDVPAHLRHIQVIRPFRLPRRHITARPSIIHHCGTTALTRQSGIPQIQPPPRSATTPTPERDTPPYLRSPSLHHHPP